DPPGRDIGGRAGQRVPSVLPADRHGDHEGDTEYDAGAEDDRHRDADVYRDAIHHGLPHLRQRRLSTPGSVTHGSEGHRGSSRLASPDDDVRSSGRLAARSY